MEQSRIQQKIDEILLDIKSIITICKERGYTNEQWFINFEDALNGCSGIDYSNTPITIPIFEGTASERLNKWLEYRDSQ